MIPAGGWAQTFLFAGLIETGYFAQEDDWDPGDFANAGPLGVPNGAPSMTSTEARKTKLNAEIANGRLAMMAIIGMFFQDGLTGAAWGDWELYTESPLRAFENELGVQAPVGYWDPLGLSADGDVDSFKRRRETELKHGRVSMLATMGYIAPEYFKFGGFLSPSAGVQFSDVPNGLAAFSKVPGAGICQIVIFCGLTEVNFGFGAYKKGGEPGNYGWKAITSSDPEAKQKKLRAELANGRLAMVAIIGMFYQDGLTGSAWGDWDLYADSPLRAFESELGVQAPVGYWDPAGYSKDGDAEAFRRRRMTEIKHGRVSMIACIGYIVPEYFKWPGLVSPSNGIAFSDVPNGLAALSKIPAGGWAQTFLFAGLIETGYFAQEDDRAPGDFANAGPLGVPNGAPSMTSAEARKTKLNAEIANGRLAMMAIIGMFFQDGLTGAAWGDWELYTASPLRAEPISAAAAALAASPISISQVQGTRAHEISRGGTARAFQG